MASLVIEIMLNYYRDHFLIFHLEISLRGTRLRKKDWLGLRKSLTESWKGKKVNSYVGSVLPLLKSILSSTLLYYIIYFRIHV